MILTIRDITSEICEEGKFLGYPTTFVNLQGCNLNCNYCNIPDTKRKRMGVQTILKCIFKMGNSRVVFRGGEPLLQETIYVLVYELVDRGYEVIIESNGSIAIQESLYKRSYSYALKLRTPSCGITTVNNYNNLDRLLCHDEVWFRIRDYNDYVFARDIMNKYPTKASYLLIAMDKEIVDQLNDWLLEDKLNKTRVNKGEVK